jgi:HAD superfamily hydrolase (TIGR01549 family)
MKPLICFDLDNTLIKSDRAHIAAFNKALTNNNLKKIPSKELAKELTGPSAEHILRKFYPKIKKELLKKIVKEHDNLVAKETYKLAKPINNPNRILKQLKTKYTLAVISNCKKKELIPLLKGAKIDHKLFKSIIGHDQVKKAKPSPDMIFKAAKLTHHKPTYIIGDSILDIRAGKKAKIKTIAVTTGHYTKKELEKEKPTKVIKDISKLPKLLL